jgi:hypothetical protein
MTITMDTGSSGIDVASDNGVIRGSVATISRIAVTGAIAVAISGIAVTGPIAVAISRVAISRVAVTAVTIAISRVAVTIG